MRAFDAETETADKGMLQLRISSKATFSAHFTTGSGFLEGADCFAAGAAVGVLDLFFFAMIKAQSSEQELSWVAFALRTLPQQTLMEKNSGEMIASTRICKYCHLCTTGTVGWFTCRKYYLRRRGVRGPSGSLDPTLQEAFHPALEPMNIIGFFKISSRRT